MDEQPVALATVMRSPYNWVINLMYGVSPQPAHAPENSNKGCTNCDDFTLVERGVISLIVTFSAIYSQRGISASCDAKGFISKALVFAGQTSAQLPQPVQSKVETCIRKPKPS